MSFEDEELQERRNMLKGMHPLMKMWYASSEVAPLKEKYGIFPLFWQDMESWEHTKILQKVYLSYTEKKESGSASVDVLAIEKRYTTPIVYEEESIADDQNGNSEAAQFQNVSATAGPEGTVPRDDADAQMPPTKKRKNRWGAPAADVVSSELEAASTTNGISAATESNGAAATDAVIDQEVKKVRRSRFGAVSEDLVASLAATTASLPGAQVPVAAAPPPPPELTAEQLQQSLVLRMQLQQINQRLLTVAQDAARIDADPNRSPSPPPKYDSNGKRTNTREFRMRDGINAERGQILEELLKLNPTYQTPSDFMKSKPVRRIYIPYKQYPQYNFIGLIIGPRGSTQKEMESQTGCKISIRGKGSVKEGSRGRATKAVIDEDEDLHIHITGDTDENVEEAAKMCENLMRPQDDDIEAHKQKQLRQLALINGTLREDEFCPVCGEQGHRQWECPHRTKTFQAAGVRCSICGDMSHPTRDCPLKQGGVQNEVVLDSEYDSFMAELTGGSSKPKPAPAPASASLGASGSTIVKNETSSAAAVTVPLASLINGSNALCGVIGSTTAQPWAAPAPPKPNQTVIHVSTMMTGTTAPPPMSTNGLQTPATSMPPAPAPAPAAASFLPPTQQFNPPNMDNGNAWGVGAMQGQVPGQMQYYGGYMNMGSNMASNMGAQVGQNLGYYNQGYAPNSGYYQQPVGQPMGHAPQMGPGMGAMAPPPPPPLPPQPDLPAQPPLPDS
jgi:splicing factor 1